MMFRSFFRRLALVSFAVACVPTVVAAQNQGAVQPPLSAPAAPAPADAAAQPANPTAGYVLGPGDVIEVAVLGRDEFKSRVQVQVDGTIQLPYLKTVKAADKTGLQLGEEVRRQLKDGGYYADPVVTVNVATYASRYVTVLGEVGSPGIVPVDRAYRLSEILARVGGAKPSGADQLSLRRADGKEMKLVVRNIASGGNDEDPFVSPGDKIYVPVADSFYIYGQVSSPGTYRVDPDMTLRKAIARGGGITERGSEKRIKVFRDGKQLSKLQLEEGIKGGDVVVVGERLF